MANADTLEYEKCPSNRDGEWFGEGYGSVKGKQIMVKENVVFPFRRSIP